ncbi:CD209 antigen-like protein E isoform X2 [Artemia franciscana]|uniref:CD209 antigen-like protein E isoform X2 n=1 Tax=Artemia franciscana TaxID=6661 RepID=UPI0032DA86C9
MRELVSYCYRFPCIKGTMKLSCAIMIICSIMLKSIHAKCPKGWSLHGGSCYIFETAAKDYRESRNRCKEVGGDLPVLRSIEEQNFVKEMAKQHDENTWIGLDSTESVRQFDLDFKWIDSTYPYFDYWAEGQPGPTERPKCVQICKHHGWKWTAFPCHSTSCFVCQKPEQ